MSQPTMRTIDDLARAVVAACERRGESVSTEAALLAATEAVAPIAGNMGIAVSSVVTRYADQNLVERIAATLLTPEESEDLHSPPMPDPAEDLLALLMSTGSALLRDRAGLSADAAHQAAMMAAVYGWMEGHIEGEDLCATPAGEHQQVPGVGEHANRRRLLELLMSTCEAVDEAHLFAGPTHATGPGGSDPAADPLAVPAVVPWPDPDAQAVALVVVNAMDGVPVPARRAGAPAVYAIAAVAWVVGHREGHRCSGCAYRGSAAHKLENDQMRSAGGGATALRVAVQGGSPRFVAGDVPLLSRRT